MSKHDTPTRKTNRRSAVTSKTASTLQPQQHHAHSSPTLTPKSHTGNQVTNPLPPLRLHLQPATDQTASSALSTHLAASRTLGRGAGRDDGNGRYNVPRKPLAVRKDTAYLLSSEHNHGGDGNGNVMTLKGLEVERQRQRQAERERERMAMANTGVVLGEEVVKGGSVGISKDVGNDKDKENRRPSDITEMEMEMDSEGGEDITPEDEDNDAEGYVGIGGITGGGVRYPKDPRECAMVWSRARGATWD